MKKILTLFALIALSSTALASNKHPALSLPGYFGSINNNTGYVIECSQIIGGYCANNPMPANGYIQMLPDPGSSAIKGHIMIYDKNVPGKYVDNLHFTYYKQRNGQWAFNIKSAYNKTFITQLRKNTIILNRHK